MKRTAYFISLLSIGLIINAQAQSGQSPTIQQSTSTVDTRQANPARPKVKKTTRQQRQRMETGLDTTLPNGHNQRPLRPDSLRRGGATRVDTIR
ncbi:hypothetical protein [Spirosoma arcticum]